MRKLVLVITALVLLFTGCSHKDKAAFRILSGSENKTLEPILMDYAKQNGIELKIDYTGSVDMMLQMQSGDMPYDAVWPANSLWIALGDKRKMVKDAKSVMRSPVVLGVKKSKAQALGWVGKDVKVADILQAATSDKLRFMMTSATQSNSGASAYIGFLYAFAGKPSVLTSEDLKKPEVREKIKGILGSVNRSAGSSGWLKDLFLQKYSAYDAMVNYESVIIEANQQLVGQGQEPLYAVYPVDGLAIADSPFGFVGSDPKKQKEFAQIQEFLLSKETQHKIMEAGRRVGVVGMDTGTMDKSVFNPAWGIDLDRVITPIKFPATEVIQEALDLYQTAFRKPSMTIYCLDFSGSMQGEAEQNVKDAMRMVLDQQEARRYMLQASPEDVTIVIPFNHQPLGMYTAHGSSPDEMSQLLARIDATHADGGTDIYHPVMDGFDLLKRTSNLEGYSTAVILMTDGESRDGYSFNDLQQHLRNVHLGMDVPVYAILFGDASKDQLEQITQSTSGRIFDGKGDLGKVFREVKGYN